MSSVTVNGKVFEISSASAGQIAQVASIVSNLTREISKNVNSDNPDNLAVLSAILSVMTEEQLISLAAVVIGSDREFAEKYFDLVWVTDALAILIEETNIKAIIANFTRIFTQIQG